MPDVTISAPVAADSIDRLILGAADVRSSGDVTAAWAGPGGPLCMADE